MMISKSKRTLRLTTAQGHAACTLATLLAVFTPFTAMAAGPISPDSGAILQQTKPELPHQPADSDTGLTIEQDQGGELPQSAPFLVESIQIFGHTQFDTDTLHALVADAEGKEITLPQLKVLADRISAYYQDQGFPLSRAIIPAQEIRNHVVKIQVVEARYDQIALNNQSRVDDSLLQDTLAPLQSGQAVRQAEMERTLLLASDIPGAGIHALLKPGAKVGTSDLAVAASDTPFLTASLKADDYGNRYTGRARGGFSVSLVNPLHRGDVLTLDGITAGEGMNYGQLSYELLLNGQGTRMGGSYAALRYELGGPLEHLQAHGTVQIGSWWLKHPFIRSRNLNLYGQVVYRRLDLRDRIDLGAIKTYRHVDSAILSVSGDLRDSLLYGGVNAWDVSWTAGQLEFDHAAAQTDDAATAQIQDGFSKWNLSLSRLQHLTGKTHLYLAFAGQWALDNLDPSQKMVMGGPYSVRAYDIGAISGDNAYLGTAELRYDLGAALYGQWQASLFVDSAHVKVNQNPWAAGPNHANLSGIGVGLSWAGLHWNARAFIATPLGPRPALIEANNPVRAWAEVGIRF